jgi:hypothetical protein
MFCFTLLRKVRAPSAIRKLMREWGLLEWGQTAIGLGGACIFGWSLMWP